MVQRNAVMVPTALLVFVLSASPAQSVRVAEAAPAVRVEAVIVPKGDTQKLQMKNKQKIKMAINQKEKILNVGPDARDPTTLLITGLAPGLSRLTLEDSEGNKEKLIVVVDDDSK